MSRWRSISGLLLIVALHVAQARRLYSGARAAIDAESDSSAREVPWRVLSSVLLMASPSGAFVAPSSCLGRGRSGSRRCVGPLMTRATSVPRTALVMMASEEDDEAVDAGNSDDDAVDSEQSGGGEDGGGPGGPLDGAKKILGQVLRVLRSWKIWVFILVARESKRLLNRAFRVKEVEVDAEPMIEVEVKVKRGWLPWSRKVVTNETSSDAPDLADAEKAALKESVDSAAIVEASGKTRKKILIIMSDTGGGHKASGKAISAALEELYPKKLDIEICDIYTTAGKWPFNAMVTGYQHLAKHPRQWKLAYEYAGFPPSRWFSERWADVQCWSGLYDLFKEKAPDMIISVHPLCQKLPLRIVTKIKGSKQRRLDELPFATVVTDLGGGHPTWLDRGIDRTFVPADVWERMAAKERLDPEKIRKYGLPIGPLFRRRSPSEKAALRSKLGLEKRLPTVLVAGGGDGVGKLQNIAKAMATELGTDADRDSQMVVVCGKNEDLKEQLESTDWPANVRVSVQGFVRNMDDWMGAADCIVTKAGPGTIAEATASGLPIMLSDFLPGQEAPNVPFVVKGGFGDFSRRPKVIAEKVSAWLKDPERLDEMSRKSSEAGRPEASKQIAMDLGDMLFKAPPPAALAPEDDAQSVEVADNSNVEEKVH